ncbi:uncharacterized protein LOC123313824 isoform X2 [Coccinella septempunctata]|uniref:uncharacterized protein LOC123313824 isoform X2 n=1 Tax=Coccinella septempunctata TaxID=41139 RepID=UPI001D07FBE4|nr:uncharacterized protein LOC123313824 isoform X2 [Coccinella septempunctata]
MELAIVWNIVITLLGCVLFQGCWTRVTNSGKEILECFDCEQIYGGNCASGKDLEKTFCFETASSCYSMVFYNPFNDGYGGKYNYRRGCTMFNKTEDHINFTSIGHSLLEEYIGPTTLCNTFLCNDDPIGEFEVEDPLGIKL